jgi:hypothetical protein
MDLPVQFPSEEQVIREEVARFRALSPEDRLRVIREVIEAGEMILERSPKSALLRRLALEQETIAQQAVKEFLKRHGG